MAFWLRSARADGRLGALRAAHGVRTAFDQLYSEQPDPWGALVPRYRYQRLKYERLLALLPRREYGEALDLGSGLGVFTRVLAPHVGHILGLDLSDVAIALAADLSRALPNVAYAQGDVRAIPLPGARQFDLVVLADVLYYLSPLTAEALDGVAEAVEDLLAPGGILLLANHCFFGWDRDSKVTRRIHDAFRRRARLRVRREAWRPFYQASVLERRA
jgi:SAM-dependent methyltransferase